MPVNLSYAHRKFTIASMVAGGVYLLVLGMLAYGVDRYQTGPLLAGWFLLFGLYLLLLWGAKEIPLLPMLLLAAGARLLLLPALPLLSDDFYRYLWDGHLLVEGLHPFSHPPEWYRQAGAPFVTGLTPELYEGLNSKQYFTIYPPLAQALFVLAAWIGGSNILLGVMVLRLLLLLAEAGSIWLMLKLLRAYRLPQRRVLLYALNPLVILELIGNLHLEALAIFFLLLLLWALKPGDKSALNSEAESAHFPKPVKLVPNVQTVAKPQQTGPGSKLLGTAEIGWLSVAFAGAVASKLWPLLLGPYLLLKLGWRKGLRWVLLSAVLLLLLFVPFFGKPLLEGMLSSLSLYYQRFEFNASLYYLFRAVGQWLIGFNPIVQLGPVLALLAAGLIIYFSKRAVRQAWPIPKTILLLYGLFLLCATTVHPWYVLPLLALMPFTDFRFPLIWSGLAFLTYAGYSPGGYKEPFGLVALEYGVVVAVLVWELRRTQLAARKEPGEQQPFIVKS